MKTLMLNGSPRADHGNTQLFIDHFQSGLTTPLPVRYLLRENPTTLALAMKEYDTILLVMPLYIHAMPGLVMKLFEELKPQSSHHQKIGFIVQAGFIESATARYLENYLSALAHRLNYTYLGTVIKGDAAACSILPHFLFDKLFKQLKALGVAYEKTGSFDPLLVKKLGNPVYLSKFQVRLLESRLVSRLNQVGWNWILKRNGCFENRYDRPFL